MEGFSMDKLIKTCKIIFSEYRLPIKIVSDAETKFILDRFKNFWKKLSIGYAVSLSYNCKLSR